ncbi:hypothetical protein AA18890_0063 [Komagataeibacter europaeus LMG 18890]|nr:hypothetical protein AA18890_0063 [Komagataeibacter europaeus LMG 18890]
MKMTRIRFTIERETKEQAKAILKENGWTMSGYLATALALITEDPVKNYPLLTGKPWPGTSPAGT